jgi:hypothetical protein
MQKRDRRTTISPGGVFEQPRDVVGVESRIAVRRGRDHDLGKARSRAMVCLSSMGLVRLRWLFVRGRNAGRSAGRWGARGNDDDRPIGDPQETVRNPDLRQAQSPRSG